MPKEVRVQQGQACIIQQHSWKMALWKPNAANCLKISSLRKDESDLDAFANRKGCRAVSPLFFVNQNPEGEPAHTQ